MKSMSISIMLVKRFVRKKSGLGSNITPSPPPVTKADCKQEKMSAPSGDMYVAIQLPSVSGADK